MAVLQQSEIRRARMASHLLLAPPSGATAASVARWFGALQAQDYQAALWAFGVRLPSHDKADIEHAVATGTVLRTWPMRGTLHFVAAEDARWMLRTTGTRALRTSSQRWRMLGLDQATADAAVEVLESALADRALLPRSALLSALEDAGISPEGQRGYHLLWYASQIGVTCVGPNQGKEQTYALLRAWAPQQRDLSGDEALSELALRYFRSHGPATQQDLQRWTGLTAKASRTGIAGAGAALAKYQSGDTVVFADPASLDAVPDAPLARLLPAFDEFLIGYKDRSASLAPQRIHDVVPGRNGVFRPTVMVDGMIVGTWTRSTTSRGLRLDVQFFERPSSRIAAAVDDQLQRYADFHGAPLRD